jgi:hypothetical protein
MFREIKEWQLAKIFCQHSLQPNIVLAGRFCYGLVALEKAINRKLPDSITDRIWDAIAPKKLGRLDEAYARALQEKVLKKCSETEIDRRLSVYDRKGFLILERDADLMKIYEANKRAIDAVLNEEADKIDSRWLPELMRAAEKVGIYPLRFN